MNYYKKRGVSTSSYAEAAWNYNYSMFNCDISPAFRIG